MRHFFTPKKFAELRVMVEKTKKIADDIVGSGFQSGAAQDGHHDEGYQLSLREIVVHDSMANNLAAVLANAEVVQPAEQNEAVYFGNAVEIIYQDGDKEKYLIESFVLPGSENSLSMNSPLGKAILGARSGERRNFVIDGRDITVTIGQIFPPSSSE